MPGRRAERAKKERVEVTEHQTPPLLRATGSKVQGSKATSYLEAPTYESLVPSPCMRQGSEVVYMGMTVSLKFLSSTLKAE